MSRIIFLGKDANFPPIHEPDLLNRVCHFLAGEEWKEGAVFRTSPRYVDRNLHPERAHHPFLLAHFHGGHDGAPYHSKIARLFDAMLLQPELHDQGDLAANLVSKYCAFVELIRFATAGNNGIFLSQVFRGILPPNAQNVPVNFAHLQGAHRNETLREWLLNDGYPNQHRVVVIPKSIFQVLCEPLVNEQAEWLQLTPGHLNQAEQWLAHEGNGHIYPLPGFRDRDWLITKGFPYFSHCTGIVIQDCLDELAGTLVQRLIGHQ